MDFDGWELLGNHRSPRTEIQWIVKSIANYAVSEDDEHSVVFGNNALNQINMCFM
jgi:hypothetical protein